MMVRHPAFSPVVNRSQWLMYLTGSTSDPSTTPFPTYATSTSCRGEPYASLIPYLSLDAAASSTLSKDLPVSVAKNAEKLFKWSIGGTSLLIEWDDPTALQVLNNATDFSASSGKPPPSPKSSSTPHLSPPSN